MRQDVVTMTNEETTQQLNDLLTRAYDAEKGYKLAADRVEDPVISTKLIEKSQARYDFGHQIKSLITTHGGSPDKGDSVSSKAHRGWIKVKDTLTSSNPEEIVEECIRGEEVAVEDYTEALKHTFPNDVSTVLSRHLATIQADLADLRTLEAALDR